MGLFSKDDKFLGKECRDKVTGFEGVAVGKAIYLFGCNQYGLAPKAEKGEMKDTHWFDEGRLEVIGDGIHAKEVTAEKPGGPNRDCPR